MRQQFGGLGLSSIPMVVRNLLIINVLMLLGTYAAGSMGIDLSDSLALHHYSSDKFMVHQLVTHMFMHGGISHLFMNMFGIWMFGKTLESVWGPKRFLTFYFICGLGAAALQLTVNTVEINKIEADVNAFIDHDDSVITHDQFLSEYRGYITREELVELPNFTEEDYAHIVLEANRDRGMVGASGALFGVLVGFGMLFPNTLLMLLFFPMPIKAKYFVSIYAAFELYSGFSSGNDGIAHFAHVGGALFGFIVIKYWKQNSKTFY